MKLCLGTAQFGMDYGIRGGKRPLPSECFSMLDYAIENGIDTIDTANAYGNAESVIGEWLKANPPMRKKINLISKLKPKLLDNISDQCISVMKKNLEQSLLNLNTDYLDGYLLHDARYVFDDEIIENLAILKKQGYIKNAGVSVYEVTEALKGIEREELSLMQLPYSIFDQRMLRGGVFDMALEKSFTIHSRSAFVQGLLLMGKDEVPEFLNNSTPFIDQLDRFCAEHGLSRAEIAIGYVKRQPGISHLVFGVDNLEQLKQFIEAFNKYVDPCLLKSAAAQFESLDHGIFMPSLWKK